MTNRGYIFAAILFLVACSSPRGIEMELPVERTAEPEFIKVNHLLVLDSLGNRVFRGQATLYADSVIYYDVYSRKRTSIPKEDIKTIYLLNRSGGISVALATIGSLVLFGAVLDHYISDESVNPDGNLGKRIGAYTGVISIPFSLGLGAALFNRRILIYEKEASNSNKLNYLTTLTTLLTTK